MRKKDIQLLEQLVRVPSPAGFEEQIAQCIKSKLLTMLPRSAVKVDDKHNVIAIVKGSTDKVVMIDAHSDEIGFIVSNINDEGLISIKYVGGGDHSILSARDLVILTDKGRINAVVNRKHHHMVEDEEDESVSSISLAEVDIGIRKRKAVNRVVKIGDPVIYRPSFNHLVENYYSGYGFDDKSGCFILIEAIREIVKSKKKPIPTLVFTFSTQEESGGRKCRPLIKKYNPQMFIEVDVTFATDYLCDDETFEKEAGRCALGKGIVLYRGVDIDKKCFKEANAIARRHKIQVQYQASTGDIGYTATEVTHESAGIKALILGIPLRNMHTPVETINTKDLYQGSRLLKYFLLSDKIKSCLC